MNRLERIKRDIAQRPYLDHNDLADYIIEHRPTGEWQLSRQVIGDLREHLADYDSRDAAITAAKQDAKTADYIISDILEGRWL